MSIHYWRQRALVILILSAGITAGPAHAKDPYEFRKVADALVCMNVNDPNDKTRPYFDCLRIGPMLVGLSLRDVSMKFGKAAKEDKRGEQILRIYPIRMNVPPGTPLPYWVIGFEGLRVVSIQLTGDREVPEFPFSSVHVGDPVARVIEILGEPSKKQDAPHIGGEMWIYSPFPVTFEIKAGKVYTMRVSEVIGK